MKDILITPEGIQKNLKTIKPLEAICEYIWNGFDANATVVKVKLTINQMTIVDEIKVTDNGTGISFEELGNKFQPFNDSQKSKNTSRSNYSLPHGRQGIGRLTFFSFAQRAKWETVYCKDGIRYSYFISMNKDSINQYDDNGGNLPVIAHEKTGTTVTFFQLIDLYKEDIIERIKGEFFWFLELNRNKAFEIWVDDEKITYEELIIRRTVLNLSEYKLKNDFDVTFIQWNISLGQEYSRFYFMGSDDKERYKEATKLNKQSDEFYHSIFIKSEYFNEFHFGNDQIEGQAGIFPNKYDLEYKTLINAICKKLIKYRKEYLKEASDKYIENLIKKNLYPEFDKSNFIDIYRKAELDHLVETLFTAQPKIFTSLNDDNKKITIHLLKVIMDNNNKSELFEVLKQVIELDEEELDELYGVLKYTTLSNITRTIKLLQDRLKVVQGLKEIVFDNKRYALEVEHVQEVLEKHYWLFGEQYTLITAAEPDFEAALRGLILAKTGDAEKVQIDHEDKNKEMDIYMIRQDRKGNITENVVVELKRPSVSLGEEQLAQVKKYMRVIKSDDRFNATNVKWTYYLVGNKYNKNGSIQDELESNMHWGEPHLVHSDRNGNNKIYALTWSDIFDEFSNRHEYLMSRLELEEKLWLEKHNSLDETIEDISENTATLEDAIIPKRMAK